MKFKVTFKDPDGPYEDVRVAVNDSLKSTGLDEDEIESVFELRLEKTMNTLGKWIKYGEYLTVEFDLDKGTCQVLENE